MKRLLSIILIVFLISCRTESQKEITSDFNKTEQTLTLADSEPLDSKMSSNGEGNTQYPAQLIKEASIHFKTKDPQLSLSKIKSLITKYKAIVSNENQISDGVNISNQIILKIDSKNFEIFLEEFEKNIENIESKTINVQNVSEEYYDLKTRLKTKKEIEERYLNILKQAKTIKDIIEVESQIGNIRTEIESMEGRIKYLESMVSYSTINISYETPNIKKDEWEFEFIDSVKTGWIIILKFLKVLVTLWPFILIAAIGFMVFRRRFKK